MESTMQATAAVRELEQLRLFENEGGPDMRKLKALASQMAGVRADNTVRGYASDWRMFELWCKEARRKALPASEETVCLYVVSKMDERKMSTIGRHVAAIMDMHRRGGLEEPSGKELKAVMAGARRTKGTAPEGKTAFTPGDLRSMCSKLRRLGTLTALRDRAILCIGFAGGMRVSEIVGLEVADLRFVAKGVWVKIRRSKTDQEGAGRDVGVFRGHRVTTCPVRTLRAWLVVRDKKFGKGGRLFPGPDGEELGTRNVWSRVKLAAELAGLNPELYGVHSLRVGCVTAAAEGGMSESLIMQRTGHKSVQMVSRYCRPVSAFSVDVLRHAM
jgi:integrase